MEAWFADLARWVRRHEAALASDASTTTLQIDLSHLHYLLVRCEGLGRDVGPLDLEVAPPRPVARPADETRSLFSIQDTLHSLSTWWGPSDAPDDRVFRYLHTQCMRVRRLRLTPATGAPGLADFPGAHATPLHTFKSLTHLTLDGVPPAAVVGWDRLCVQLTHLTALHTGVPDMADVFVDLVRRDTRRDSLPAAAWHALRHVALPHNELTFLSSDALDALPALAHLDVSHNLLNAVPPALDSAPHLQSLSVADNLIDSVLGIYHTLPHIRALDLRGNRVDSLCGVERLALLAQLDLRDNLVADVREVGRLATLPHLSHVWIAGNPVLRAEPDARVACLAEFALERHAVVLDDAAPSFWERRRLAERLSHQVPAGASRGGELSVPAAPVRRVVPASPRSPARRARPRAARTATASPTAPPTQAYRERIEQLRSRQGDDWLRTVARSELGEDASAFPVHAVVEVAPIESFPWPVRSFVRVVSHPVGAAAVSAAALGGGAFLWWRFFRRIPSAAYITPAVLRSRRMLVGRVTRYVLTTYAAWATRMASVCTTRRACRSCARGGTVCRRRRASCGARPSRCASRAPTPLRPRTLGARASPLRTRRAPSCGASSRAAPCGSTWRTSTSTSGSSASRTCGAGRTCGAARTCRSRSCAAASRPCTAAQALRTARRGGAAARPPMPRPAPPGPPFLSPRP